MNWVFKSFVNILEVQLICSFCKENSLIFLALFVRSLLCWNTWTAVTPSSTESPIFHLDDPSGSAEFKFCLLTPSSPSVGCLLCNELWICVSGPIQSLIYHLPLQKGADGAPFICTDRIRSKAVCTWMCPTTSTTTSSVSLSCLWKRGSLTPLIIPELS